VKEIMNSNDLDRNIISRLALFIKSWTKIHFTLKDVFIVRIYRLFNCSNGKKRNDKRIDKQALLKRGEAKIIQELDCVHILKKMRSIDIITKVLFA
jgi:hypothetical protein